ncbi:acylamino-acid-releasing enzyme [Parasteatoda tepidariorum]|uniref:acylamino-acid-releasing enzyme n=1 Tax=Parasteatoda tepidariorum TaxID=114398 RepID=UPI001C719713|nr:acylamino-acid-releasing enzyme [Parasteatoda tepidariorum]
MKILKFIWLHHIIRTTSKTNFLSTMSTKTEQYVGLYKEISAVPAVTSAVILPKASNKTLLLHSTWSSQDLVKLEKTSFSRDYVFDSESFKIISTGIPYDTNSLVHQSFSKSGEKQAIIRGNKSSKNSNECYDLEIWNESKKVNTFELTDRDDHGKINTNAFGTLVWSSDENFILYTAEAKQPKSSSYFKILNKTTVEDDTKENRGSEYAYREEWGEDLVGSHHSVAIILDLKTATTEIISSDKLYNELSIGEAIWGPGDETVIFVGYKEFPRRLGLRSCTNRSSAIYVYNRQTKEIDCITGESNVSVRNPRFSLDFKSLFYLENKVGGPHFSGSKLKKYDWESKQISTVIDLVDSPGIADFPGLYVTSVPQRCWFKNNLFLTSQWRSFLSILCIDTDNGTIQRIEPKVLSHPEGVEDSFGTSTVFSINENFILAEFSSPNIEPCLVIGKISKGENISVSWKYLDSNKPIKHPDIEWKVVQINAEKTEHCFEAIITTPANKQNISSAIIRPHGGPHSSYTPNFLKGIVAFTKLNYVNCLVNYRGSVGFGENSIHSLPGNVGKHDVEEVQQIAEWIKNQSDFTIKNSFVIGGSHGGFLGAHLVGQYPDFYKGAVLLNPVVDIAGMTETTDIPDWNWVEGGCGDMYDPSTAINPDQLKSMWEKSPIRYVENVCTPVLLLLGSKDLRVPYAQGLKYYKILKARKVPVEIYVYEDCHSLKKTPHDADVFMQTALWLEKYSS